MGMFGWLCNVGLRRCYRQGYAASVRADGWPELESCPYAKSTDEAKAWLRGWNDHFDPLWTATVRP
jgi:ribosome modulation factor